MNCLYCRAGYHFECAAPIPSGDSLYVCCCSGKQTPIVIGGNKSERGGYQKDAEAMRDPLSTGRKRAVLAKPINPGDICEWANLKNAGGGVVPIVGCKGNEAKAIHHGPDKDVLNNSPENLHALCHQCHNRWHAKNDGYYGDRPAPGTPFVPILPRQEDAPVVCLPHDPVTKAELTEIYEAEVSWQLQKEKENESVGIDVVG